MPSVDDYLSLVPAQHADKPRFMATLRALIEPVVAQQALLAGMPAAFDLDEAVGAQLDAVGLWVGASRIVALPIPDVFFGWDEDGLGWEAGVWRGPYDDTTGLTRLDDDAFRLLLRAKIAANHWDGTLAGAARALAYVYGADGSRVFIQDEQDMSVSFNVAGNLLSPVKRALLSGGYIPLKPAGVRLAAVNIVTLGGEALFGFDLANPSVNGWDAGAWGAPDGTPA